jgi:hypothetical protein
MWRNNGNKRKHYAEDGCYMHLKTTTKMAKAISSRDAY